MYSNETLANTFLYKFNCFDTYVFKIACCALIFNIFRLRFPPGVSIATILNRDALWSIQGKKHYLQAAIVGGIHHTGKILR